MVSKRRFMIVYSEWGRRVPEGGKRHDEQEIRGF
jgi:hypothetical protein